MAEYNFKEVEKKWQEKWEREKSFKAVDFHPTKPKYYMLYEFPNVSWNLHMGHLKGTVPSDAFVAFLAVIECIGIKLGYWFWYVDFL